MFNDFTNLIFYFFQIKNYYNNLSEDITLKNNWSNTEAKKYIKKYQKLGHSKDMALRVYTTRLLGRNSELVLHGGGNTSVKTSIKDIDGKNYDVLCVKSSG